MAMLKEEGQESFLYLRNPHIFGRNSAKVDTLLTGNDISQIHASLRWNGQHWELIDHSRNGSFLNGKRLELNHKAKLEIGDKLHFGISPQRCWQVMNLKPPQALLLASSPLATTAELQEFHFLPNATEALGAVYLSPDGHYLYEDQEGSRILQDGDQVQCAGHVWRFFRPLHIEATEEAVLAALSTPKNLTPICFNFSANQNEEHIFLSIDTKAKNIDLGERSHHYCLLTLARQRLADSQRGLDSHSQGWISVEELSRMLGLNVTHLNTQLFRARSQIMQEAPEHSSLQTVLERRRGEVRFGVFRFRILRGAALEADFTPPASPQHPPAV